MKQTLALILRFLVVLALGAGAILLAMALNSNMEGYRSPLKDMPPAPGKTFGEPLSERLVIVLIDGLRYDTAENTEVMPSLNQLRNLGASAKMYSHPPSYSSPGYGVILTGAWPSINDLPPFNLDYENYYPLSQDNIFSAAKRHGLRTAISSYYWFEKIILPEAIDIGFFTPDKDQKADRRVVNAAIPWLEEDEYELVFIHLNQVDYAGHHEGGPAKENWNKAAQRVDNLLLEISSKLNYSKDTLLIISNHGHIDRGGHGGHDAVTLLEPFVLIGKGVNAGVYEDIYLVDVAPTVAAILGTNLPASTQGRVLTEMLRMPDDSSQTLKNETARQQAQLLASYASAIGVPLPEEATDIDASLGVSGYQKVFQKLQRDKLSRERLVRLAITAAGFLALLILIAVLKPKELKMLLAAWFVFTVLFHVVILTLGPKGYSYSTIRSVPQFLLLNGSNTLLALGVTWLLFTFQNWAKMDLKQNFNKLIDLTLFLMALTAIPLIAHIAWNGLFAKWILPNFFIHYMALLSLIQVFSMAVGTLLLVITAIFILLSKRRKTA